MGSLWHLKSVEISASWCVPPTMKTTARKMEPWKKQRHICDNYTDHVLLVRGIGFIQARQTPCNKQELRRMQSWGHRFMFQFKQLGLTENT